MTDLAEAIERGWASAEPDAPEPTQILVTLALDHIDRDELQRYQRALRYYAAALTT